MANNFLVLVALAAVGWAVVDGPPSQRDPAASSSSPRAVANGASRPSTAAVMRSVAPVARQDPVPLVRPELVRPGLVPAVRAVVPPAGAPATEAVPAASDESRPPPDELDRNAARAAAEADGYKRVSIVGRAGNGAWRVRGYRGATEVLLMVDGTGRVSME